MFGIRYVLMSGDGGDGGGGGRDETNTNTVEVVERSFQSPGTGSGQAIDRDTKFFRAKSPAERTASEKFAGFIGGGLGGAIAGPAGSFAGSQLLKRLARGSKTFETDEQGRRLGGTIAGRSEGGRDEGGFSFLASQAARGSSNIGGTNIGGGRVASAADRAIQQALGFQEAAAEAGTISLREGQEAALAALSPFAETGISALEQQRAFFGLSGAEAEQAALQGFTESPGARFAQQEEEQAIVRNALALGDVGGGRVRDELGRRAAGRFGTRLDTRLAQLGQLSGQGQQAAFGQSGIQQSTAANLSNLFLGTGENQASAVLGQQVAAAASQSEANRIAALQQQQKSQQDAAFQSQLFGLGASIAKPFISRFF